MTVGEGERCPRPIEEEGVAKDVDMAKDVATILTSVSAVENEALKGGVSSTIKTIPLASTHDWLTDGASGRAWKDPTANKHHKERRDTPHTQQRHALTH